MARWGMVIDLRKCIGCEMCSSVCSELNRNPCGANWRQVIDRTIEENPDLIRLFVPMNCMHCSEPPCLDVCPSGATYQRKDGIVDIKNELCIGCGYCVVACPYSARTISFRDKIQIKFAEGLHNPTVVKSDRIGICTKCNFCLQRIEDGLAKGLKPGKDPDAGPICVNFCIAEALFFGDLDDPESNVSHLIRKNKTVCLQEELGTKPSVYYIIKSQ
jgi:phenylacetyl-CoA:acceptor oxidoreductase subunit 1